ncbi:MAG TPA: D-alanine--D-alanine ligase [Gammaproteobacteria bacterium]|nr:D-alanine--D-alanine ligase [Gammaproteobacteria bacterium]
MTDKTYSKSDYGRVAVLMGGLSAERNISLESGQAVFAALERKGVDAFLLDVQKDVLSRLQEGNFDRAFIALHGRGGEDGVMQGALEVLQLPYTGSGVPGSAVAMNKTMTKRIWQSCGLPTPRFTELTASTDWQSVCDQQGLPLMVKPVHEGSSLGASKVKKAGDLKQAWESAFTFDSHVMAEQWITGKEYTAPVLGDSVLPLIRLATPREFYDYEAKYETDSTQYICPCGLDAAMESKLGELALTAFRVIGGSGWGRIDFMLDEQQQPWLIEANTIPGMTSHSLVPMSARQAGIDFDQLVLRILDTSMNRDL